MPYEKRRNGMQPVPFRNDAVPREARQRTAVKDSHVSTE